MTVSPITSDYGIFAANSTSSATGSSGTSGTGGSSDDSQMFLQLMVAQLKYQDPMNPADSATMLTQNATFTEVQAVQEMQKEMGLVLSSQLAFGSASLVGKDVSWVDSTTGAVKSGTVDSVDFATSGPVVNVGDQQIPINSVASVGGGSSSTTGSTSGTTGTTGSSTSNTSNGTSTNA